jgi:hypothetical protein
MTPRRSGYRAVRPAAEGLESRELLSKTITGADADGDTWVLKLIGPGDVRVVNQNGPDGNPIALGQPAEISTITVAGANPLTTRLVGRVTKSPTGDGKVFFQNLNELGGQSEGVSATNGIFAIDMPDFWLGHTSTTAPTAGAHAADISIPDGIITLRFGGVDTTFTPPGGTPLTQGTANTLMNVALGLPRTQGTSIIIKKAVSSAKPAAGTTAAVQNAVEFHVEGRINVFQADAIEGNSAVPPTSLFEGQGGTIVFSSDGREPNSIAASVLQGQITGQIGYARVGGNATNFAVLTNDKVSNFYIGGETNNVSLLAPGGSRNVYFGKGMDTTTIRSHTISSLRANRGALNSDVTVDRTIGQTMIGGDVVNTHVLSGYEQNLLSVFTNQRDPTTTAPAQDGGALPNILIAGNVTNSVFAASAQPLDNVFGNNDLLLPHGRIKAKVEGMIDNSTETPDQPTNPFYAKAVQLFHGPVTPPNVPEEPFPHPGMAPSGPRVVKGLLPNFIGPQQRHTTTPPTPKSGVTTATAHPQSTLTSRPAQKK